MKADCARVQSYLDGRLDAAERSAFEAHLAGCDGCRQAVASWRTFSHAFQATTASLLGPPAAGDTRRLLNKVAERRTPQRLVWWVAAGATACLALATIFLWRSGQPSGFDEPVGLWAIAADGTQAPVETSTLEAREQPARFALGSDRIGLSRAGAIRVERRDRRQVRLHLERGSVALAVSHRERGQSFSVLSGEYEVSVVGTQFRVTRLGEGLQVEVREGHVRVQRRDSTPVDVLAGAVLRIENGSLEQTTRADSPFPELADSPPPADTEAADAGAAAGPPDEATEPAGDGDGDEVDAEASGPDRRPGLTTARLERWRKAALAGRCTEIIEQVRTALRRHPSEVQGWRVLADCLRLTGKDRDAAVAYQRVIALGSVDEADRARLLVADLYMRLGKPAEAAKVLRVYLQHPQAPPLEAAARVKLGRALLMLKQTHRARVELERVVRERPESQSALEAMELLKTLDSK